MSNLLQIRTQFYALIGEVGNSHYTDPEVNVLANLAQKLISSLIELPRKHSSGTQVTEGMGDITLPADNLLILDAYYGDNTKAGDMTRLNVVKEQVIPPIWMDTATSSEGLPLNFFKRNETTGLIYPRANVNAAVIGKKVFFDYVYIPADMVNDTDSPAQPAPYHDVMQFYMAYLAYFGKLANSNLAASMFNQFMAHHKLIQSAATKETREGFGWQWTERWDDEGDMVLNVQ